MKLLLFLIISSLFITFVSTDQENDHRIGNLRRELFRRGGGNRRRRRRRPRPKPNTYYYYDSKSSKSKNYSSQRYGYSKSKSKSRKKYYNYHYHDYTMLTACIGRYPGYAGPLSPRGSVSAKFYGRDFIISYDLTGLEECNDNGCGIYFHEGTSCNVDAGDRLWTPKTAPDPWDAVRVVFGSGVSSGQITMNNGYDIVGNFDHAVVIHGQNGTRIGCGVLKYGWQHCW